ncbi:MAG: shikimate kinase, partial [Methylocystis sp.]
MTTSSCAETTLAPADPRPAMIRAYLEDNCIVLVGMMGSGKSSIGQKLAHRLGLKFVDADAEIAAAAGMSIPEIFAKFGEGYFRDGERRVLYRLLNGGPMVLATGGGAFLDPRTRRRIAERGVSIWFDADPETLLRRVRRKGERPLLQTEDPAATLRRLMDERNPVYATADLRVVSHDVPHEAMVDQTLTLLAERLPTLAFGAKRPLEDLPSSMTHFAPRREEPLHRETVRVDLGPRSYEILIGSGLLKEAGEQIAALAAGAACAIMTDSNVAPLYLQP